MEPQQPFASKKLPCGSGLFQNVHGVGKDISANSSDSIKISMPYDKCKIDWVQILYAYKKDRVDFKVLDTPQGHIQMSKGVPPESVVPSAVLKQYGHGAYLAEGNHPCDSKYDADLIKDMEIEVVIYNNTDTSNFYAVNFKIHEVAAP